MDRPKNYDLPYESEELDDLEKETILSYEQINNTGFFENDDSYPPNGSLLNLPTNLFLSSKVSPFSMDEESEAYRRYKEIEGLDD